MKEIYIYTLLLLPLWSKHLAVQPLFFSPGKETLDGDLSVLHPLPANKTSAGTVQYGEWVQIGQGGETHAPSFMKDPFKEREKADG